MKKKVLSVLLVASMAAALLAGCGSGTEETEPAAPAAEESEAPAQEAPAEEAEAPAEASGEDVTITYWGWDSNFYELMFAAYTEAHPNVHFEPVATEWGDMLTKAQQALASNSELPVLVPMDNALIENWKKMDIMEDLTTLGLNPDEYSDIYVKKATTADGKVIGVFENVAPSGIAYKRDMAKQYFGTDDPDELFEIFSSYDAYVEKSADVKADGKFMFHSGQAVAWDFIKWATSDKDGATTMRDQAGYITPYKALLNDSAFTARPADEEFFGGEDVGALYYQDIMQAMKVADSSTWENEVVSVRNDVSQQIMDDPGMTLDQALANGMEELKQLVTDSEIVIE